MEAWWNKEIEHFHEAQKNIRRAWENKQLNHSLEKKKNWKKKKKKNRSHFLMALFELIPLAAET